MFTRIVVPTNTRVALLLDGRFVRIFGPGDHVLFTGFQLAEQVRIPVAEVPTRVPAGDAIPPDTPGLTEFVVGANERVAAFVAERFVGLFPPGRFRHVDAAGALRLVRFDLLAEPGPIQADDTLPAMTGVTELASTAAQALVLTRDGVPVRALEKGRFRLVQGAPFAIVAVPLGLQLLELAPQDLLTADAVPVRVKPAVTFRVADAFRFTEQREPLPQVHAAIHAALREVVSAHPLDTLLGERAPLDTELLERVRAGLPALGVVAERAVVRDVTLAGEVRELFNRVTLAKKEAEALAIKRREETAATRQLANTAKLLAENPVLLRLRELEAMAEIAREVQQLTLVGGRELLDGVRLAEHGRS